MARAAFQLAMISNKVRAEVVEVQEFPELARKYEIRTVPLTIVNDKERLNGAVPPMFLVEAVEKAVNGPAESAPPTE